jgi:hypothetical protein
MTTPIAPFATLVPETIDSPSRCTVEHLYDPSALASAGWVDHECTIVSDDDLMVIVQQGDIFASVERSGCPAKLERREAAVVSFHVEHEQSGGPDVDCLRPTVALKLAAGLANAVAIIDVERARDLEHSAFKLGHDAQAEGLPATHDVPR